MTKSEQIKQLEQTLTKLLGKNNYIEYSKACTGKYRGYYDYGLEFEDGAKYYISTGRQYYFERLTEKVEMYQYFHDNYEYLEQRVKEIIERDNRQAAKLGLEPVEFISLHMINTKNKYYDYLFWIGIKYKQYGIDFWYTDTNFYYACCGVGFNDEKSVEVYFDKKINRPDEKLGRFNDFDNEKYASIIMGCLHRINENLILT